MTSYESVVVDAPDLEEVTLEHPCPICHAASGCALLIGQGRPPVVCLSTRSDWPLLGGGWLHFPASSSDQDRSAPLPAAATSR